MLLVARRKQQPNTEMGRENTFLEMSDWWLLIRILNLLLFYSFELLEMCFRCSQNGYDIKVCVRGRDGNGSQVPIVASYDLIVSVIDWKISWHTIGLYMGRRRFELRPPTPVICNLWSMDRSGISITRKYKFISWRKLPVCLFVRPVKENFERERRSEKFCGIFQRKNVIRK